MEKSFFEIAIGFLEPFFLFFLATIVSSLAAYAIYRNSEKEKISNKAISQRHVPVHNEVISNKAKDCERSSLAAVGLSEKAYSTTRKKTWAERERNYCKRERLLSPYESAMLFVMRVALGKKFEIFCNVRLADLVNINIPKWQTRKRNIELNDIARLHIDFVVCSRVRTEILFTVELDDPSHDNENGLKRDARKNKALEAAGIPIRRFRVEEKIRHGELRELFLADAVIGPLLRDSAED